MSGVMAYLGLGSNMGNRRAMIDSAVGHLDTVPGVRVCAMSSVIETEPVGMVEDANPFLNAAAAVETTLPPGELLERCLAIEAAHGRVREGAMRWGPRSLDIDLLLYGGRVIDEPGLHVPHPRLQERGFVLAPLAEIAGPVVHPVLGATIQSLLARLVSLPAAEYDPAGRCLH